MGWIAAGCLLYVLLIPGMYVVIVLIDRIITGNYHVPRTGWGISSLIWPLPLYLAVMFALIMMLVVLVVAPFKLAKGGRAELDRWINE